MYYESRTDSNRKTTTLPQLFISSGSLRSEGELRLVSLLGALESVGSPREEEDPLSYLTISITKHFVCWRGSEDIPFYKLLCRLNSLNGRET